MEETNLELEAPIEFLQKQGDTLDAINKYDFTVYAGAVAAGKTLLLAHAAISTCVNYPNVKGIIGSLTYTQLTNVVFTVFKEELGKYQDILNKNDIPITLMKRCVESAGKMMVEFYNGSIVYFLAMDKEEKLRGYTIDFFCLDEPIEIAEEIFDQLIARMRGKGLPHRFALLTTNPGAETHWIYEKFYNAVDKEKFHHIDTNSYENIFLPKGYIENMEATYDEDWKRRFLNGQWGAYSGQIYKEFDVTKHVINTSSVENDIMYYIAGVDWGIRNPSAITVIGITKDKVAYLVHEYYQNETTSTKVVRVLKELDNKYNFRKIFVDPSAADLIAQAEELKLSVEKADNNVNAGIGKVKSMIRSKQFFVDRECHNTIREFGAYRYQRDKIDGTLTEKPVKADDHALDSIRYALFSFKLFRRKASWSFVPNPIIY